MYDRDCLYKSTSTNMYMYPTLLLIIATPEILIAIAHNFAASFLMRPAGFLMRPAGFLMQAVGYRRIHPNGHDLPKG